MATDQVVTPADATLAGYLQSIELAVVNAYDNIGAFLSDTTKPIAAKFQGHHKEYADALLVHAGTSAVKLPNPSLAFVLGARVQGVTDERSALTMAVGVENQVAETYAFALTTLTTPDVIHLVATILPVVASHAVILGSSAGLSTAALFPNGALEGAMVGDGADTKLGYDPASFPVG
ncbi:MAG: hypothetical protein QOI95_1019 [Acidimicrobiaceae bacterium]|jgi:hypothetical protein